MNKALQISPVRLPLGEKAQLVFRCVSLYIFHKLISTILIITRDIENSIQHIFSGW